MASKSTVLTIPIEGTQSPVATDPRIAGSVPCQQKFFPIFTLHQPDLLSDPGYRSPNKMDSGFMKYSLFGTLP